MIWQVFSLNLEEDPAQRVPVREVTLGLNHTLYYRPHYLQYIHIYCFENPPNQRNWEIIGFVIRESLARSLGGAFLCDNRSRTFCLMATYLSPLIQKSCGHSSRSLAEKFGKYWLVIQECRLAGQTAEICEIGIILKNKRTNIVFDYKQTQCLTINKHSA